MKYFFLFLFLLPFQMFSQSKSIQMTNDKGETVFIHQDKRVKIVTQDGRTHFGRINILDEEHLILRKDTIAISDIKSIQRRSVAKAVMTGVVIGLSGIAIPVGTLILIGDTAGGAIIASGFAGIPGGILISPLGKKYKSKHWKYKVVQR